MKEKSHPPGKGEWLEEAEFNVANAKVGDRSSPVKSNLALVDLNLSQVSSLHTQIRKCPRFREIA